MTKPRVLLADDHALVREGMRNILAPDHEIVGEAKDGRELVRAATELRPDVIVADIGMPNLNGLEAIRQLQKEGLQAKTVFLTMHAGVDFAVQAFRLGASGYLLKVDASEELVRAIKEALAGRLYITPSIAKDVMMVLMEGPKAPSENEEPWAKLTGREREVLHLIADGLSSKEIASEVGVSLKTIDSHRSNLMEKLDIHKVSGLVRFAIREGLVEP